jgi:hypothetical protein
MTVTVFTCTVGQTDRVRPPTVVNPQVRYINFSDKGSSPSPYQHVPIQAPDSCASARLLSRQIKILANRPELGAPTVTLWHDAAYQMGCDPERVARQHLIGLDLLAFKHPKRSLIADEAVAIDRLGYVPKATLDQQIATYTAEGFTQHAITSTGFCIRRDTPAVQRFNTLWWQEVHRWGWRDQMSVDYAIWKAGIRADYIPGHYRDNPFARWFPDGAK